MEKQDQPVDTPPYGILLQIGHWENAPIEEGDRRLARWAVHTHVDQKTTETRLEAAMKILLDAGYRGCWGVEHHSGKTNMPRWRCNWPTCAGPWRSFRPRLLPRQIAPGAIT